MSTSTPQRVREGTTTILRIPLADSAGTGIEAAGLTTITATMTSLDTGATIFTGRDVLASLAAGVLSLELTPADLTMVTTRDVEWRALVLSATYGSGKAWNSPVVVVEVTNLPGV
ncbi:hypothetical protein [Luteitalea sp.]|uniref:hypothetical protein n=1 Tax=Luteitalea sp. TaxID=2004800 RepID=UPI0025BB7BA2|nr:hypothetical protein [Luteitalea sp.]